MRIDIITVLPELLENFTQESTRWTSGVVLTTTPLAALPVWLCNASP